MIKKISVPSSIVSITFITICWFLWIDVITLWLYTILLCTDFFLWFSISILRKNFTSNRAINWVFKKLVLIIAIFVLWVTWKIVWFDYLSWLIKWFFIAFSVAECHSILWHILSVITWKPKQEKDLIAFIFKAILNLIEVWIRKYIDKKTLWIEKDK